MRAMVASLFFTRAMTTETLPDSKNSPASRRPDIDTVHKDIALANTYRLEGIKAAVAISTALLAFTVSFRPTLSHIDNGGLMLASWILLAVSVLGGLLNLYGWERFYISYRDHDLKGTDK